MSVDDKCLTYATGKIGTPLDLITFHAKGSPAFVENRVRMGVGNQLRSINEHFAVIKEFPTKEA